MGSKPLRNPNFFDLGPAAVANLPSIKGAGVQIMPCPGPKIPWQTVTYPSRPSCAIYREAAAVSSSADRDALSRGYGNAPLAQGPTDLQLCSFYPRFTKAALTAAFAGVLHTDHRRAARFSSKDGQQTIRFRGGTNGSNLILSSGESSTNPTPRWPVDLAGVAHLPWTSLPTSQNLTY